MKTAALLLSVGAIAGLTAHASADTLLYSKDFNAPGYDARWSNLTHTFQQPFGSFAGRYSSGWTSVNLPIAPGPESASNNNGGGDPGDTGDTGGDPGDTNNNNNGGGGPTLVYYKLVFDLLVIDSWDGDEQSWGSDRFLVLLNGNPIFNQSFANQHTSQTYPRGPVVPVNLGFGSAPDAIYTDVTVTFSTPVGTPLLARFQDGGLQGMADESWGIDNVRLYSTVPAPGALALVGGAGLMAARRRR